ncbi:putative peptide transporter-like [Capsicum annuum]|nr:putative peptide transporter-like [Capsicum annuum]
MAKKSNGGWYVERDQENSYDRVRWLNLMISEPYYLFHLLVFFTYIPVRISAFQILSPARNSFLLKREIQVFVAYCVLTIVKIVRTESWESFIQDILLFAKIFLTAIALVLDYHLSLWYALAFLVIHIIAQQPPYEGLGSSNHLTPLQLESLLTEGNTSRFWLVDSLQFLYLYFLLSVVGLLPPRRLNNIHVFSYGDCGESLGDLAIWEILLSCIVQAETYKNLVLKIQHIYVHPAYPVCFSLSRT